MTSQQKRRFTLALNGFMRVSNRLRDKWSFKTSREYDKRREHLYRVVNQLIAHGVHYGQKLVRNRQYGRIGKKNRCTCPASVDITFTGHLPGCPES